MDKCPRCGAEIATQIDKDGKTGACATCDWRQDTPVSEFVDNTSGWHPDNNPPIGPPKAPEHEDAIRARYEAIVEHRGDALDRAVEAGVDPDAAPRGYTEIQALILYDDYEKLQELHRKVEPL